jgi:hypothetical protein
MNLSICIILGMALVVVCVLWAISVRNLKERIGIEKKTREDTDKLLNEALGKLRHAEELNGKLDERNKILEAAYTDGRVLPAAWELIQGLAKWRRNGSQKGCPKNQALKLLDSLVPILKSGNHSYPAELQKRIIERLATVAGGDFYLSIFETRKIGGGEINIGWHRMGVSYITKPYFYD